METQNLNTLRRFAPEKMQKVGLFETPRLFCDLYCLEAGQAQKAHSHGTPTRCIWFSTDTLRSKSAGIATT
jgi:hypothetical protein